MKKIRIIISGLIIFVFLVVMLPVYAHAAPMMGTKAELKAFHGKWLSDRWVPEGYLIHQTLKMRCDVETNYCKMELIAEGSRSCTAANDGIPTDALLIGEGYVEIINDTIEIYVDGYCLTKPPTYTSSFPVTFTYNLADDTLTDNLGVIWYRK